MAVAYKVVIDCADPHRLAPFWAAALDYVVEDHSTMIKQLLDAGLVSEAETSTVDGQLRFRDAAVVRDPAGRWTSAAGWGSAAGCCSRWCPSPRR
jgi:hypothetical protein